MARRLPVESGDGRHQAYERRQPPHSIHPTFTRARTKLISRDTTYPSRAIRTNLFSLGGACQGETVWMDLGSDPDIYLARVAWTLAPYRADRVAGTSRCCVSFFDIADGRSYTPDHRVGRTPGSNLSDDVTPLLEVGNTLVERAQRLSPPLSLRCRGREAVRQVTSGDWVVESWVVALDETKASSFISK